MSRMFQLEQSNETSNAKQLEPQPIMISTMALPPLNKYDKPSGPQGIAKFLFAKKGNDLEPDYDDG